MSITLGGICWKGGDPPETKLLQDRDFIHSSKWFPQGTSEQDENRGP